MDGRHRGPEGGRIPYTYADILSQDPLDLRLYAEAQDLRRRA